MLVRFKPEVTEDQKQEWKNAISALATKIPSVKEVNTGKKVPTSRDGGWDDGKEYFFPHNRDANANIIGVVMLFDNVEGLREYLPHPAHTEFVASSGSVIAGESSPPSGTHG